MAGKKSRDRTVPEDADFPLNGPWKDGVSFREVLLNVEAQMTRRTRRARKPDGEPD